VEVAERRRKLHLAELTQAIAVATSAAFSGDEKGLKRFTDQLTRNDARERRAAQDDISRALLRMANAGKVRIDGPNRR